jgi:hypothetical protein
MMSQTLTPKEAIASWECPVARTMHKPGTNGMCKGDTCAAWRYLPLLANDPAFKSAVQREIEAMHADSGQSKDLLHKAAVARVTADPSAYSVPGHHERGYCGLGSRP